MDDAALIEKIASEALGAAPPSDPQVQPGGAPIKQDTEKPTAQEMAVEAAAPKDDGAQEALTMIKVKFKDGERDMTPEQISSMAERYSGLNYKHQQLKPVIHLVETLLKGAQERGIDASPEDLAKFLAATITAGQPNPQMGNTQNVEPQRAGMPDDNDADDPLSSWEKENAVSLPPGYKELPARLHAMQQAMLQQQQLIQQLLQGTTQLKQGNEQQVQDMQTQLRDQRVMAIKQSIANNLGAAQQQFQFSDEQEPAFMDFAMRRGFTLEDFVDPEIVMQLATDFKREIDAPEADRLRALNSRRQAFTGAASAAPSGGGASPPAPPADPFLASMIEKHMRA